MGTSMKRWRWVRAAFVAGLLLGSSGCGLDTPDRGEDEHDHAHGASDLRVGSATRGGGELGLDYDFRRVNQLDCETIAGIVFCSTSDPGFVPLERAEIVFFPIPEGVAVRLELTALDSGVRVAVRGTTLDAPGESVLLGSSAEELHVHPQWQVVVAPEDLARTYSVSFKLTTDAVGFDASEVYTLLFGLASSSGS